MLSDVARQQIRGQMVAGELSGESVYKIARDVRQTIAEDGFKVMVDRAGRKWQLPDYSEMLARTHLIKTANEGVVNRMAVLGYDIVEWSIGDNPCDLCDDLNGKLFSISGDSSEYDALSEQPPRHPNCRCSLLPRPELS
jgi:SPP1 gp7 family putative phage head morphogenesis protein